MQEAHAYIDAKGAPIVVKADGLAAGKGVVVAMTLEEAHGAIDMMLSDNKLGDAGARVVIEEFLDGIELSCFVLTDGKNYKILPTAKDYKRIGEGDTGLNTGGMGAISPVPFADTALMQKIESQIVIPTIQGLNNDNIEYKGFVFIGLIKVGDNPFVIEYNVRMGDPETEVVIPRIKSDLVALFEAVASEKLIDFNLDIDSKTAATIVVVSGGYPEEFEKGKQIFGLDTKTESLIFHAGTKEENGKIVSNGGRVLAVTSFGDTFSTATKKSYQTIENLKFDKMNYRKDIGFDL
jgi:phosphoribosylamine--glycine ligase